MKPSDYPEDESRTAPFQAEPEEAARRSAEVRPRYVDLPVDPEAWRANRNLTVGLVSLSFAALGLWLSSYFAGPAGVLTVLACLASFGLALVFQRGRVLTQRHGMLFGLGLTTLIGAALPFISAGVHKVDQYARDNLGEKQAEGQRLSEPPPPPTRAQGNIPPPPMARGEISAPTVQMPEETDEPEPEAKPQKAVASTGAKKSEKSTLQTRPTGPDGTERELIVSLPPPGTPKLMTVKEDLKVDLDGRPTIIRAGTVTTFKDVTDGIVTFFANDHEIKIDLASVKLGGPSQEKPEDLRAVSMREAIRRYPQLGVEGSPEKELFKTKELEMKVDRQLSEAVFSDPHWPVTLAEGLAKEHNWERADAPIDEVGGAKPGEQPGNFPQDQPNANGPTRTTNPAPLPPATPRPRIDNAGDREGEAVIREIEARDAAERAEREFRKRGIPANEAPAELPPAPTTPTFPPAPSETPQQTAPVPPGPAPANSAPAPGVPPVAKKIR